MTGSVPRRNKVMTWAGQWPMALSLEEFRPGARRGTAEASAEAAWAAEAATGAKQNILKKCHNYIIKELLREKVKEEILKRFDKMVREGDFGVIPGSDSVRSFISEVIELLTKSK